MLLNADLTWNVSYLDEYSVTAFRGADPIAYAGMITGGNGSYTQWRSDAALTIRRGPWSGTWGVQYIGQAEDINTDTGPGSHVDSLSYHNVQARYRVNDGIEIAFASIICSMRTPHVASWTDANTDTMICSVSAGICAPVGTCNSGLGRQAESRRPPSALGHPSND